MTWTVTALGTGGTSTTVSTPVASITLTGLTISVGDGIAVFVQYTNTVADSITVADNASPPNSYPSADSVVGTANGQCLASFYCASAAHTATTITVNDSTGAFLQSFGVLKFNSTIAGNPTLDGHSGIETVTPGTVAGSSTANSTNGDVVLSAIVGAGAGTLQSPISIAITGSASPVVRNNQDTVAGYADGSGVTTTGGANSVTSTWTVFSSQAHVVLQMIFKEPPLAPPDAFGQTIFRIRGNPWRREANRWRRPRPKLWLPSPLHPSFA